MAPRLSTGSLLAFSSPGVAATLMIAPIFGVLPSYYALHTGVTLAQIGAGFLIARVIDALLDPLVGILSDRTRSALGARLPWMIAGAALALPALYFLFLPASSADARYFLVWSFLGMLAWSMLTIPHGAWAAELSDNYDERSRIFGIRNVLAQIGGFSFFLLPPLLQPLTGTTEVNESTMRALVIVLWVLLPSTLVWAALKAPARTARADRLLLPPSSLASIFRSMVRNRPFLSFVSITVIGGVATGMTTALMFLYVQDYMRLGEYFYLVGVLGALPAVLATPVWLWASRRYNKHTAWAAGALLGSGISLLLLLLPPGQSSLIPMLLIITCAGAMHGVIVALPSSILADIADYEAWKQNTNATGNYFSVLVLLSKVTAAVGSSLALFASDLLGYVPHASAEANRTALLVPLVVIPALLGLASVFLIYRFPLDRRRQQVISRRLLQRAERLARVGTTP